MFNAFQTHEFVEKALPAFEETRRRSGNEFTLAAHNSYIWYEKLSDTMKLEPFAFTFEFMSRTGRVDYEGLRKRDPRFVAAYEAQQASG